ncbi:MAG: hypothetical protein M1825_006374 [Sarcosagium campestre]|nr:MAG: hypothetical protein M1825_006374 [Sarcosagium campestre]
MPRGNKVTKNCRKKSQTGKEKDASGGARMFNVIIGKVDKEKVFPVPEQILCDLSPVLRAACRSEFKEAHDSEIDLGEDDPAAFEHILRWAYKSLPAPSEDTFIALFKVFALAERLKIPSLMNKLIDDIIRMSADKHLVPRVPEIAFIYGKTFPGAPIRKALVDCYTWCVATAWYSQKGSVKMLASVPDFAAELSVSVNRRRIGKPKVNPFELQYSQAYHYEDPPAKATVVDLVEDGQTAAEQA